MTEHPASRKVTKHETARSQDVIGVAFCDTVVDDVGIQIGQCRLETACTSSSATTRMSCFRYGLEVFEQFQHGQCDTS